MGKKTNKEPLGSTYKSRVREEHRNNALTIPTTPSNNKSLKGYQNTTSTKLLSPFPGSCFQNYGRHFPSSIITLHLNFCFAHTPRLAWLVYPKAHKDMFNGSKINTHSCSEVFLHLFPSRKNSNRKRLSKHNAGGQPA